MNPKNLKPKKLIREFIIEKLKEGEWETITDQSELNRLYEIKIREELAEIQASNHNDIMEFVDLISVAYSFARVNGFDPNSISLAIREKKESKGDFDRLALNNLNPDNPSNKIYFPVTIENLTRKEAIDYANMMQKAFIHQWEFRQKVVAANKIKFDID